MTWTCAPARCSYGRCAPNRTRAASVLASRCWKRSSISVSRARSCSASPVMDWNQQTCTPYWTGVWFGIIQAGGLLLGIGAVQAIRGVDMTNHRALARSLRLVQIVQVVSTAVFALATNFPLAVLALWSSRAVSQLSQPLYDTWLTGSAPSHIRATIISAASQANALGQVLGGPVVGTIGRLLSLRVALLAAGLLLLPSVGLLTRSHALAESNPSLADPD